MNDSSSLKLGFIGLGIMGAPMALHLIKAGHQLFVFTHGKLHPEIAASGARNSCDTPRTRSDCIASRARTFPRTRRRRQMPGTASGPRHRR